MSINKTALWVAGVPYYLWATYHTIGMLVMSIGIIKNANVSIVAGVILAIVFVSLGYWLILMPLYFLWGGQVIGKTWAEDAPTEGKMYGRFILATIGIPAAVYAWNTILLIIMTWILL